jgi:hypothetical protein
LDYCGDETTCGHGGFGEAGLCLLARRMNKPGITLGMQTVLVSDVHRNRPRAYTHRHKVWANPDKAWTKQGPCKVRRIIEQLGAMVIGEPNCSDTRQIFTEKPHSTWDNYFSGNLILDYLGENGFAAMMTCQRNRLPKGVDDCFLVSTLGKDCSKGPSCPGCQVQPPNYSCDNQDEGETDASDCSWQRRRKRPAY